MRGVINAISYFFSLIIGGLITLISILITIIKNHLFENKTQFNGFNRKTLRFHTGNVPENNNPNNLKCMFRIFQHKFTKGEDWYKKDDIKNLYVLHYYANHYHNISINTRRMTLVSISILIGSFITQIIIWVVIFEIWILTVVIGVAFFIIMVIYTLKKRFR